MNQNGLYNSAFYPRLDGIASPPINWDQEFSRVDVKGKGRAIDKDFEEAFSRAAALVSKEHSRIVEVKDDTESLEAAFERTTIGDDTPTLGDKEKSDFEK